MIPLELISARYDNPLLSASRPSVSSGFTRLADSIADQYGSAFSGTSLTSLYTSQGTLTSTLTSPTQPSQPSLSSGFQRQTALAAYDTNRSPVPLTKPSTTPLATSIRQSALAAPLSLYGASQPSLAQSLDLFA